ncbi:hypothetical protein MPDQ_006758 [Monascus purpureus]|uniref:Uncharacterized protein n=1 Tax=Monascus purpureus TaxID=5098 RepID=A0A507QVP7_MONPU|nr:hypothetical protein MPDQ_006758 [Monascus purpureus]
MRLNLVIQRHGLPITRILWTTSLPSFLGGSALGSSYVPASSSVIASSRAPNAAYANGYTIAQLLEDVNEVVPLETGVDLGGDGHSGVWGLEDYVVEVGGFECLHFMEVEGLLRDGDEVVIRALQTSDLRARRLSGRHQISVDGRHLIDGVPFGRSFLKRSTSSRPAIAIPPRKRRRTTLSNWQLPDTYGAEGEDCAPLGHEDTDRSLANDEYVDEGTVIRHNVEADEDSQLSESDADYAEDEEENLQEELSGLKEDMETSGLRGDIEEDEQRASAGYALRLRSSSGEEPSDEVPAQSASPATTLSVAEKQPGMDFRPRALRLRSSSRPKALSKSPAANPPSIVSSAARSSRTDYSPKGSKLVRFRNENKEPLPPTSLKKGAYASGQPLLARAVVPGDEVEPTLSDSTSSTSVSSDTSSNEDDSELESEIEEATETEEEDSMSETDDDSTSELEAVSKSEDEEMSESEVSEDEAVPTVVSKGKPRPETSAPGNGSLRTKKNNRRCKLRRRLSKLKELGALPPNADFAALRAWESANGRWYEPPETKPPGTEDTYAEASAKKKEQEEFEEKRQKLLRQLESGGIDMDGISEEDRVSPPALEEDTQMTTETAEEVGAQPVNEAEARLESELSKRRTLDLASSKRLLFGSLGVRAPRSKEEEEVTRKKLAGKANHFQSRRRSSVPDSAPEAEGDLEVNWQDKLVIKATECIFDDIELTAPPFPFEQRWDSEAHGIIRQRKGRGKGKKRRRRARIYEEESWEEDYENGFNGYENGDVQLNYDDTEQTNDDENSGNAIEVEQNSKPPKSPSEDLPVLSDDLSSVPDLVESEIKLGSIIAYKQLDMSKATNWQPKVSDYRVAEVHEVLEDGVAKVRLAKRDRMKPVDNADEDGPREYSGFEMPGYEDNETEDDGFREVSFGELIEPKLLRPAARTDPDAAEPEDAQGVDMSVN